MVRIENVSRCFTADTEILPGSRANGLLNQENAALRPPQKLNPVQEFKARPNVGPIYPRLARDTPFSGYQSAAT